MKKVSPVVAVLLASLSVGAYAAHGGAGGAQMGGMSSQHMSSKGMTNTNGQSSADRDFGLARAGERRNAAATSHENADTAQSKHKHASKRTAN